MGANLGSSSSSRNRRGRRRGAFADINITPMVDVMLVLLVIFMVTAPLITAGVDVNLPSSKAAPLNDKTEPLTVSIKSDGSVFLQNTKVEPQELGPKLSAVLGEKNDTRIFVRGDASIDYGKIMQVMGEINAAGFSKVALITDPNPPAAASRRR
jgi:biopolymer transport protein TolR